MSSFWIAQLDQRTDRDHACCCVEKPVHREEEAQASERTLRSPWVVAAGAVHCPAASQGFRIFPEFCYIEQQNVACHLTVLLT